jgi:hypothetical protein
MILFVILLLEITNEKFWLLSQDFEIELKKYFETMRSVL